MNMCTKFSVVCGENQIPTHELLSDVFWEKGIGGDISKNMEKLICTPYKRSWEIFLTLVYPTSIFNLRTLFESVQRRGLRSVRAEVGARILEQSPSKVGDGLILGTRPLEGKLLVLHPDAMYECSTTEVTISKLPWVFEYKRIRV